jgi:hypothetical protein
MLQYLSIYKKVEKLYKNYAQALSFVQTHQQDKLWARRLGENRK